MSEPQKYRKKPVVIEAMRWDGRESTKRRILAWAGRHVHGWSSLDFLRIATLEGDMRADIGDFIIKGVQGEFYPCEPSIFEATYEAVCDE